MSAVEILARRHAERAVQTIADIMDNPIEEAKDRLAAARDLLDRGFGKPVNSVVAIPASKSRALALAAMADSDLLEIVRASPLPRLAAPDVIEGEFEEVDPLLA